MKYFIKGTAFKTKFEFECEFNAACQNIATLRVWLDKESWKENTIVAIKRETLQKIVDTLIQANNYQTDCKINYRSYDDLKDREKTYIDAYNYYIEKFTPIENMFFS